VRVLGYFTNFVLLAAFLGFGVGIIAARRWPAARFPSFLAPVALMAFVLLTALGNLLNVVPSSAEVLFLEYQEHRQSMPLYPFLALAFARSRHASSRSATSWGAPSRAIGRCGATA